MLARWGYCLNDDGNVRQLARTSQFQWHNWKQWGESWRCLWFQWWDLHGHGKVHVFQVVPWSLLLAIHEPISKALDANIHSSRVEIDFFLLYGVFCRTLIDIQIRFNFWWVFYVIYIIMVSLRVSTLLRIVVILWLMSLLPMSKDIEHHWFGVIKIIPLEWTLS